MKTITYILAGTGAFFGIRYFRSLLRTGDKAVVEVKGKVANVTMQGVVVILKYNIKNPARNSIKMTPPLVKLIYKKADGSESILASSSMALVDIPVASKDSNGRIKIPAFNETGLITTRIIIPLLNLIGLSNGLLAKLKDPSQKVQLIIETNATLFTAVGSFPFDQQTTIEL